MQYQQLNAIQLNFILAIYKKFQGCIITILGNMTNIFWLLFSLNKHSNVRCSTQSILLQKNELKIN